MKSFAQLDERQMMFWSAEENLFDFLYRISWKIIQSYFKIFAESKSDYLSIQYNIIFPNLFGSIWKALDFSSAPMDQYLIVVALE